MRRSAIAMSKPSVKPGRNDPCPCGSGNKYKRCCGVETGALSSPDSPNPQEIGALVALVNQERLSEAEHKSRTLLARHPDAGMLWKILGVALMRRGKDALQALRRTTELMPQDGETHGNLGAALHDLGRWDEALASLRRALAIQPRNVEALVDAADALRALGQPREAVALYQRALELSPRLIEAHNNLGNAFLELGQHDDALSCYRCALQIRPDDVQILCNLGNAQRRLGFPDEAIASYRRALALEPDSSIAHNNLGDVLRDLGLRREAASLYARAVEFDPERAESHYNLANALFELRRINEAAASYARALELQPRYAPAHLSLAVARRAQRRHTDAEASCQAALSIDPNYVEALSLLGELRADRGKFSEAEKLFQRAIEINPDFSSAFANIATYRKMTREDTDWLKGAEALLAKRLPLEHEISLRYALGKYFDDVGQYDDAFEHYRQANELTKRQGSGYDRTKLTQRVHEIIRHFALYRELFQGTPEDAETHLSIAHALKTLGQRDEAIEYYRRAAACRPNFGDAYWSLANLKTYRFADEELTQLRAAQADPTIGLIDRFHLCFALGKALEDRGEYAESFRYYELGNALKRSESKYRPEIIENNTRQQIEVCSREFFASRRGWGAQNPDPIFIVGLPRSGSTLIEQILASHSKVEGTQELANVLHIVSKLRGHDPDPNNQRYPRILTKPAAEDFRQLGEKYLADARVYRTDRAFFIDKMPNNFRHLGLIRLMLPRAKIIDARREPIACCFSNLKQLFDKEQEFTYSVEDIARYYRTYLELMRHWDHVLPGWILRVHHEDVVDDLEGNVRRILDFCGLEFEPQCIEFHKTVRIVRTASSEQVRLPIYREGLDQWKNFEPWLEPLKAALGDALNHYRDD